MWGAGEPAAGPPSQPRPWGPGRPHPPAPGPREAAVAWGMDAVLGCHGHHRGHFLFLFHVSCSAVYRDSALIEARHRTPHIVSVLLGFVRNMDVVTGGPECSDAPGVRARPSRFTTLGPVLVHDPGALPGSRPRGPYWFTAWGPGNLLSDDSKLVMLMRWVLTPPKGGGGSPIGANRVVGGWKLSVALPHFWARWRPEVDSVGSDYVSLQDRMRPHDAHSTALVPVWGAPGGTALHPGSL